LKLRQFLFTRAAAEKKWLAREERAQKKFEKKRAEEEKRQAEKEELKVRIRVNLTPLTRFKYNLTNKTRFNNSNTLQSCVEQRFNCDAVPLNCH
jgi:hypothetical protein